MNCTIGSSFVIGFSTIGCAVASIIGTERLGVVNGAVKSARLLAERNGDQLAAAIADLRASHSAWGERPYQWTGYGAATSRISVSIRSAILCADSRSWATVQSAA